MPRCARGMRKASPAKQRSRRNNILSVDEALGKASCNIHMARAPLDHLSQMISHLLKRGAVIIQQG